jgi:hypothetical protein
LAKTLESGTNPYFSHERFHEAHDLIIRAWTDVIQRAPALVDAVTFDKTDRSHDAAAHADHGENNDHRSRLDRAAWAVGSFSHVGNRPDLRVETTRCIPPSSLVGDVQRAMTSRKAVIDGTKK